MSATIIAFPTAPRVPSQTLLWSDRSKPPSPEALARIAEAKRFDHARELTGSPDFRVRATGIETMLELEREGESQVCLWAHRFLMDYRFYRAMRRKRA